MTERAMTMYAVGSNSWRYFAAAIRNDCDDNATSYWTGLLEKKIALSRWHDMSAADSIR